MNLPNGTLLQGGKYRIEGVLGQGGFGITYRATHTALGSQVAIKEFFLRTANSRGSDGRSVTVPVVANLSDFVSQRGKFKREAQRIQALKSDLIVRVWDLFEENGTAYYVMEYIEGQSLDQFLSKRGQMKESEALMMLEQVLDALSVIHANQLLHLDIKPSNIMRVADGKFKLIDFGASKQLIADLTQTEASAVARTPGYAPPEQLSGNIASLGPWTDFYALGATLFVVLTGESIPTEMESFRFTNAVSDKMQRLIRWMMRHNRKDRPQSVAEIKKWLGNERPKKRVAWAYWLVAMLLLAACFGLYRWMFPRNDVGKWKTDNNGIKYREIVVDGVKFKIIYVRGCAFEMYNHPLYVVTEPSDSPDTIPKHWVSLSNFAIGETEVTQALWNAVMGSDSVFYTPGLQNPVESVSEADCETFIRKLNLKTGLRFRLPTEAEWEFAARGGIKDGNYLYSGSNDLDSVAWIAHGVYRSTRVKQMMPNQLGIYDMSGNVAEMCLEVVRSDSYQINPKPKRGEYCFRGGACVMESNCDIINVRSCDWYETPSALAGFRLLLEIDPIDDLIDDMVDIKGEHDYSISRYEITQDQWMAVMGPDNNPSKFRGPNSPINNVSWDYCHEFINRLNKMTKMQFRLPTESEWLYAAQGGDAAAGFIYAGSNTVDEVAWYNANSNDRAHVVGAKSANGFGLYDMSGNVWEWCADSLPGGGDLRVRCGGGWFSPPEHCQISANRYHQQSSPKWANDASIGFRLVRDK